MARCKLHTFIPVLISRKKPHGFFQGRPAWYEEEVWVVSLNGKRDGIGWASKFDAEQYAQVMHGELHGAKTLDEALVYE